jgi:hypothetical protein
MQPLPRRRVIPSCGPSAGFPQSIINHPLGIITSPTLHIIILFGLKFPLMKSVEFVKEMPDFNITFFSKTSCFYFVQIEQIQIENSGTGFYKNYCTTDIK